MFFPLPNYYTKSWSLRKFYYLFMFHIDRYIMACIHKENIFKSSFKEILLLLIIRKEKFQINFFVYWNEWTMGETIIFHIYIHIYKVPFLHLSKCMDFLSPVLTFFLHKSIVNAITINFLSSIRSLIHTLRKMSDYNKIH